MRCWQMGILTIGAMTALSGCGYGVSVDNRSMVSAIGFDPAQHGQQIISAEIINPLATAASPTPIGPPDVVFYAKAHSITNALSTIQEQAPGDLDLSGAQLVVFSSAYLRRGILPAVSFLVRPGNGRLAAYVVVSSLSARAFMSVPIASTAATPYFQIYDVESFVAPRRPEIAKTPLWMVYRALYTPWMGTIIPLINATGKKIRFNGSVLLANGKLSGRLSSQDTAIVNMLTKGAAGLRISTLVNGQTVSINISQVKISLGVNRRLHGDLHLAVHGLVEEDSRGLNPPDHRHWRDLVEKAFALRLDSVVSQTLTQLQRGHDDVIGFGLRLRAQHPTVWNKVRSRWPKRFSEMPVAIQVKVKTSSAGP